MRSAHFIRMLAILPALALTSSCSEPLPSRVYAVTGLWEVTANFTEYSGSDYTTIPLTGPSLHGLLTITQPANAQGTSFTWDGVEGAFTAIPCKTFGTSGTCAQLGDVVQLDGLSGSITVAPDAPDGARSYLSLQYAPANPLISLQEIEVRGDSMTGRAYWVPMYGVPRPASYDGTFVAHRKCSALGRTACAGCGLMCIVQP